MTIQDNLRQLRQSSGLTQEQVAEKVGITRQALSSYESGRTRPDIDMLMRLGEIYGTDLEGILYGQERRLKAVRRIKTIAKILFVLLVILTFISAALLWSMNRFFPLAEDGPLSAEEMLVMEGRIGLNRAWQITDGCILAAAFWGAALLLYFLIREKTAIVMKVKLTYVTALGAAMLVVAITFGLLDPLYGMRNYVFTPVAVIIQLMLFLLADVIIEYFRRRKHG